MRERTTQWTRLFIIGLLALGMFGLGTVRASAQSGEVCNLNGALALADSNGDGVVSLGEIDGIIALAGGNAELQAVRNQAAASGITGIRYTGCTPGGGAEAPSGDTGSGSGGAASSGNTGSGSGGSGSSDAGSVANSASSGGAQGDAGQSGQSSASASSGTSEAGSATTSGANSSGVTGLPGTGVGVLTMQGGESTQMSGTILVLAAAGGLLMLSGLFVFRTREA